MRSNLRGVGAGISGLLVLTLAIAAAGTARAAVNADVRAGVYPSADAVSVGGGVLANMGGEDSHWYFNPNVEVAMGDRKDIVAMSGDFHYDFDTQSNTAFWMGAGPAVLVTDRKDASSDTNLGMNVLTGVGAKRGQVRPFAQLRGTVASEGQVTIAGGIRF
jgi:hypothetical protein